MPRQSTVPREMWKIRSSFMQIARSFDRLGPMLQAAAVGNAVTTSTERPARKKPRLTAEWRRALKLQGQYMGTMRGLKPRQRARVKKIRAEKGIRAAIREARRMAG